MFLPEVKYNGTRAHFQCDPTMINSLHGELLALHPSSGASVYTHHACPLPSVISPVIVLRKTFFLLGVMGVNDYGIDIGVFTHSCFLADEVQLLYVWLP